MSEYIVIQNSEARSLIAGMLRAERLADLEVKALKRVKRRKVSLTVALILDRPAGRTAYWEARIHEAQKLADNLWIARVNPNVPADARL